MDPIAGVAYVMVPAGGISAVDLSTGATRWTSTAGELPLALVGNQLVAQVEPRRPTNRLEVVSLSTAERGKLVSRAVTNLASNVRVSIGETLRGNFLLTAQPAGSDVTLEWTFVPAPVRGMEDERDTASAGAPNAAPVVRRGSFRVRVSNGAVTTANARQIATQRTTKWIVASEAKVRNAAGTQYASADGRHIVASERVADDRVWDKHRWTLFERATGRRLGEFRTHVSFSPFVVRDSLVVFETTPYERRGQPPEPAKLRAISLATGREAWSVPVRELVFRGPMPP
jgi:hypothetical protein